MPFRAITLPYVGELTAYSLGSSSVFQSNDPAGYFADSLDLLGNYFQGQTERRIPRITSPAEWERIMRENQRADPAPPAPQAEGPTPGQCVDRDGKIVRCGSPEDVGQVLSEEGALKVRKGKGGDLSVECGNFDFGCQLDQWIKGDTAKDVGKRIAILIIAVVIIGAGIFSLK